MKDKKQLIFNIILLVLSVLLIITTLFVPLVHIVAYDTNPAVVYDKTVNLLTYSKDAVFATTDAADVYFSATGPMWLPILGIFCNYLIFVFAFVMLAIAIFELATIKKENLIIKQNNLLKKMAKFVGIFGIITAVLEIVSFIITTQMANGYGEFYSSVQVYFSFAISVAMIVFAVLLPKNKEEQTDQKVRNAIGFGLTGLFSLLSLAMIFLPVYSDIYMVEPTKSIFGLAMQANMFVGISPAGGDYPIGISQYAIFAVIFATAFVFIYSLIGFIFTLCGKKANWLSIRIKRWTFAVLIANVVLDCLVLATAAVLMSFVYVENLSILSPLAYFAVLMPFIPFVASRIVSCQKVKKVKKVEVTK